ncbi:MAG: hypothetical protein K9I94_04965 [Bacteroidales bacterium]|nr:hypothetical protein [Bacteroidales bacterium]
MSKKQLLVIVIVIIAIAGLITWFMIFRSQARGKQYEFASHIAAFTSGVISNQDNIRIVFMEEVPGAKKNMAIDRDLFDFKPSIKGSAFWVDKRTLEFRTENTLPSGQAYETEFELDEVIDVPRQLSTFHFRFQTKKQAFEASFKGLQTYDPNQLQWQQLIGNLHTADFVQDARVEKMLLPTQNNRKLSVTWQHSADGKRHRFTVDSIRRKKEAEKVVVVLNGKPLGLEQKKEKTFEIPPLGEFKLVNLSVHHKPQYISLMFSDPLDEQQYLQGLVRMETGTGLNFTINGNEIRAYPETRQKGKIKVTVDGAIKNSQEYKLGSPYTTSVNFESIKPAVKLIGGGNLLPDSDGLLLPFKAVSLNGVHVRIIKVFRNNILQFFQDNDYDGKQHLKHVGRIVYEDDIKLRSDQPIDYGEWNTFTLDLSDMITTEPGAIYRVQLNIKKDHSRYPCPDEEDDEIPDIQTDLFEEEVDQSDVNYWSWSGYNHYSYYNNNYNWQERNNPCKESYYMHYNRAVEKNVLASNLGITAKTGETGRMIFAVTDLITTKPIDNVEISIYNFQQQLIDRVKTDSKGLADIDLEKKPFILIAKKDDQYGYLRLDDGSALSVSMFNVSGRKTKKGLKGYIYGERGVWRPGDSLFVSFFLEDPENVIPETHPILFDLVNPKGQVVEREIRTSGKNGLFTFATQTDPDAITGNYRARIKVGGATFENPLKIEAVKPNRLKTELDFGVDKITRQNLDDIKGKLSINWLHGAPGRNLKANIKMKFTEVKTTFDGYPGFTFSDPSEEFTPKETVIFDGKVNDDGKVSFDPGFSTPRNAPGMLKAHFTLRAFETSGNYSITRKSMPFSPFSSYVGIKVPKGSGWHGALNSQKAHQIPVITVNEDGGKVSRNRIRVEVFKINWRWWWEHRDEDYLSRYVSSRSRDLISSDIISTVNGEGHYKLKLDQNYWGRVFIRVTDIESGHSTGEVAYMDWPGWRRQGSELPDGAAILSFTTNKEVYSTGEEVLVKFPSADSSRALVSLESGSRIVDHFWVKTQQEQTQFQFKTTPEMAPNVYVYVSLIQPHNQTANDRPIRLYGIQPIRVEDPETHLGPVIKMPDVLEPNENFTINVKESNNKAMNYTLAVVDEGLLDLTGFNTPHPWDHFYARDALGVKTWDMYDYVMGAFTGEFAGMLSLGGGIEVDREDASRANRFEPVVMFAGPFHLKPGSSRKHRFKMPNYVGSVRTMLVAGANGAYGSTEKTTSVKKPLMVLGTMPRVLRPEEKIKLPVTVFAMDKSVKEIKVTLETNEFLTTPDRSTRYIIMDKPGTRVLNFDYEVAERLGVATVKIIAESNGREAIHNIVLDVKALNPEITKVDKYTLKAGGSKTFTSDPIGLKGTNNATVELSSFPPLNLEQRLDYLIHYPYGCIEQLISSVFPQLYLHRFVELEKERKQIIQQNIEEAISRLMSFQTSEGGFAYWPGNDWVSGWGTNYAGHFLLEAQEQGYDLPVGLLDNWKKFQEKGSRYYASNFPRRRGDDLKQAYRLYTLALVGDPAMGDMNRMREDEDISLQAKWRLAAAYTLAGKKEVALNMVEDLTTGINEYRSTGGTYGSHVRDQAMILETLVLLNKTGEAESLVQDLAGQLGSGRWLSTQTTSYSLLAISKFLGDQEIDAAIDVEYTIDRRNPQRAFTKQPFIRLDVREAGRAHRIKLVNNGDSRVFARMIRSGIPAGTKEEAAYSYLQMNVRYLNMDEIEIDPEELEQGTDFMAEVTMKHPGTRDDYEELVLTQIFSSGWEIHNSRLDNVSGKKDNGFDYRDIRDDRVHTFFDLQSGSAKTFRVKLNAAYIGRYYLPMVSCQAMYDNEIYAQKPGQWVEVVMPGK